MEEADKTGKKFRWMGWIFGMAAILAAFHVGIIFWLQTDSGLQTLKRLIIRIIEQNVEATCRISELRGNPMGDLEFMGLELRVHEAESALLVIDRINVSFRLLPMLAGKIWISNMEIAGARATLEKTRENKWNIETLIREDPNSSKTGIGFFTLDIRRLVISGAEGLLIRRDANQKSIRQSMTLSCRAAAAVDREISLHLTHLAFALDAPQIVVADGAGRLRFDPEVGRIDIQEMRLSSDNSRITVDGRLMTTMERPAMDMRVILEALSLQEVGRAIQTEVADVGIASGEIHVTGALDDLNGRLFLELDGSRLQAEGAIGVDDLRYVNMDVSGRLINVNPDMLPGSVFKEFGGNLNAEIRVAGRYQGADGFFGNIALELEPSRVAGYDIDAASLRFAVQGPDLGVEILRLDTPYGGCRGRAVVQGIIAEDQAKNIDVTITAYDVNPAMLFSINDFESALNFSLQAGLVLPPDFDITNSGGNAHVRMLPSKVTDVEIFSGELKTAWSGDQVRIENFSLNGDMGEITASGAGSWRDRLCHGVASATILDLGSMRPIIKNYFQEVNLSGSAVLETTFSGTPDSWIAESEIRAAAVAVQGVSAEKLVVACRWRGGTKDFSLSADVRGEEIRYDELRFSRLSFSSFWSPNEVEAELTVNAASGEELVISGNIYDWVGPVRKIRLNHMALSSDAFPALVSASPWQVIVSGDRVFIESFKLVSREASFQAGGVFEFMQPGRISAEMSIQNCDLQMILGFFEGGEGIDGCVTAHMAMSGFSDAPEIALSASLFEGVFKGFDLSEVHIKAAYRDARGEVDASFFGPNQKLADVRGEAVCRLALYPYVFSLEPETVVLSVAVDDISITDLAPFWSAAGTMGGRISGFANMSGVGGGPIIDASLSLSDLVYRDFSLSSVEMSATYAAERLQVQTAGFMDERKVIEAAGSVPIRLTLSPFGYAPIPDSMNVAVDVYDLDISGLDGLTRHPGYAITGIARFSAEIAGAIDNPLVTGRLSLREGSLYLKQQRLFYQRLTVDLAFDPDTIEIKEIRMTEDDGGFVSLEGIVHHDRFRPGALDISARGSETRIPFYPGLSGRMSPDLKLGGTWDAPFLSGDITIPRGQVNLDVLFSQQLSEIKIIEPFADDNGVFRISDQRPPALAAIDPLQAAITVTVPGNVWLRGEDESIEIRGRVNVEKEPGRSFVVYGPLNAVRGTYRFRGKLFKITSGELNFIGQDVIDPPLNIQAETRIGDVRIIIYLSGTYERLTMRFDSDPPMDEVDIISYLIFGRPQTSLTEGESFRAGEAALAITGQIAADELREILGDRFRIDYINISAGSGGFQHGSLSMGKYLTPRVFVIYRHTFASEDPQQVEVYYEINRYFSLETQINDEKTSAVDLIWKYEF